MSVYIILIPEDPASNWPAWQVSILLYRAFHNVLRDNNNFL